MLNLTGRRQVASSCQTEGSSPISGSLFRIKFAVDKLADKLSPFSELRTDDDLAELVIVFHHLKMLTQVGLLVLY